MTTELTGLPELRASLEADLPAYLRDLERLVNIDCGSYTPDGVDEVGAFVAAFLRDLGLDVELRPDPSGRFGTTVIGTLTGSAGGARVLLIGHMDTVFDPGTAAERPFAVTDGIATGPGVTDMKSGLLPGLYALKALLASPEGSAFERLTFVANPDEQTGSATTPPNTRDLSADANSCPV